jgi:hypothetical protein
MVELPAVNIYLVLNYTFSTKEPKVPEDASHYDRAVRWDIKYVSLYFCSFFLMSPSPKTLDLGFLSFLPFYFAAPD